MKQTIEALILIIVFPFILGAYAISLVVWFFIDLFKRNNKERGVFDEELEE